MDGAQIFHLYIAFAKENFLQRVGGREENEKISM
jgi:hypothetical protein